jgi:hypothetical protein
VCDLANSSKYLNNDESAMALESFLQRFLYLSLLFVDSAGGEFVKWTGDGFLAWFETPLHRNVGLAASSVFNAAWHLSFLVNVTQLNVKADAKFKIRHAVTLEHDALIIDLEHSHKRSADVLGRAVILAFRLSSITCDFPGIVSQRELVTAVRDTHLIQFRKMKFSKEDCLKYFKGEKWGIRNIFVSGERKRPKRPVRSLLKQIKSAIGHAEGRIQSDVNSLDFQQKLSREVASGPQWLKEVMASLEEFIQIHFLETLKKTVPLIEATLKEVSDRPAS